MFGIIHLILNLNWTQGKIGYRLGCKTKETPQLRDLIGGVQNYGPKEFTLGSMFEIWKKEVTLRELFIKFLKEGWNHGFGASLRNTILLNNELARHLSKSISKVGWNILDLLLPSQTLWEDSRILKKGVPKEPIVLNPRSAYARLAWPTHQNRFMIARHHFLSVITSTPFMYKPSSSCFSQYNMSLMPRLSN